MRICAGPVRAIYEVIHTLYLNIINAWSNETSTNSQVIYRPICYPISLMYKLTITLEDPATSSIPIETEGHVNSLEQTAFRQVITVVHEFAAHPKI
jgi:hypothetical protein